ncbi:nucleotidyltransferase domain-containing protein [Candidatus Uhrbacteria bacterium]|nr:nucleotidyltransferase domain-containing protein [Candidatus Uhrbacteria bacterium]
MIAITFTNNEKEILQQLGIDALLLFGSHAQGTATAMSDIDIGVILTPPALTNTPERRRVYDALYDLFSEKLQKFVTIDIVFLHDAPMELQSHVATHGLSLYERTPDTFARFRERVFDAYADFAPLRRIFHDAILARIPSSV